MSGVPCFVGTRIPVDSVIAMFNYGYTDSLVLKAYPDLTLADIEQARVWVANTEGAVQP
jgi:uncharacterized protein (DUF433 family)